MSDRVLIVATSGGEPKSVTTEVYVANSLEEADRFVALWNEHELKWAQTVGGYPGNAYVIADELPSVADWVAEQT